MNNDDRFWNRESLYEEVWSTPLRTLAKKYGISDVALAKNCRKLSIPLPGRGYWARVSAGYREKKTPLPKLSAEIRIEKPNLQHTQAVQEPQFAESELRLIEKLKNTTDGFSLRRGSLTHPLIVQARNVLKDAWEDNRKILQAKEQCLNIRVSKGQLERALRIMAGFIDALDQVGFTVAIEADSRGITSVDIYGQRVAFGLIEKVKQVDLTPAPSEGILKKVLSYGHKETAFQPTGQLFIEIEHTYDVGQKRWGDRNGVGLEKMFPQVVVGFVRIAAIERERITKRQEAEQQRRQWEAERARLQEAIKIEEARIQALYKAVANWVRAEEIRSFICAARTEAIQNGRQIEPETELSNWLLWAEHQADRIDPLKESPSSIIDRKKEVQPSYSYNYGDKESELKLELPKPIWKI